VKWRWPWSKRRPAAPEIPPFKLDFKPLEPRDPAYVVEERDMSEKTGMFYFPWLNKKKDDEGK
jgi:hypothetical protein